MPTQKHNQQFQELQRPHTLELVKGTMTLTNFRTLGRSGLVVSPLALGTMTFGTQRWGSSDEGSAAVFNAYVDAGGNFVDTADIYAGGHSEELVGRFITERKLRHQIVLASKFTWNATPGNPNAGGNGRKNIHRALEASLRRLQTDYLDVYWLHHWDTVTPVEDVLETLGNLVRAGRIRYFGLSNVPAWYATKAALLAQVHGTPGPVALQLAYSLEERGIEREHVPAALELGLGITPWSPLAAGFLSGKYARGDGKVSGQGRLDGPNPFGDRLFTQHNWQVLEVLRGVASELDRPLAQVALAWVTVQPGVTAPILGASRVEQVRDNLAALEVRFTPQQLETLNASGPPDDLYAAISPPAVQRSIFGGAEVQGWQ
jgi:aryl-alcohol dehydrogenase-like predicted oxidoreductase